MAFVYSCTPTSHLTSSGSANTELANMAFRQTTRNCDINSFWCVGRGAGLTALSGIGFRVKRWTTVGSSGNALTPAPRRIGTTASTVVVDSNGTAITAGTVSGALVLGFGCGAAGPGGWTARDPDSVITTEAGSADEITAYSVSGTTSLNFDLSAEIAE